MSTLLTVEHLEAGYGRTTVLRDATLSVDEGEIVVILGPNGAGKTTALKAISGLIPSKGRVELDGRAIGGARAEDVARLGLGHLPQGRGTFADLTVEENLLVGAHARKDKAGIRSDMQIWYSRFPVLGDRRRQQAGNLSGGEQQMLAISRALMMRPRLLLLDEPSFGLSPRLVQEAFTVLAELNREMGTAMLIVEQSASLALRIASHAHLLEAGAIVLSARADELDAHPDVRRAYLGY